MKSFFALGLTMAVAATVTANTINWSLTNFDVNAGNNTTKKLSDYQVYFLPANYSVGTDGIATTDGTAIQSSFVNYDTTLEGSFDIADSIDKANFLMTLYSGGKYYALSDGSAPVVINYDSSKLDPFSGAYEAGNDLMGPTVAQSPSYTTVAATVPEPATAVLALAGIAMLIRRRRS